MRLAPIAFVLFTSFAVVTAVPARIDKLKKPTLPSLESGHKPDDPEALVYHCRAIAILGGKKHNTERRLNGTGPNFKSREEHQAFFQGNIETLEGAQKEHAAKRDESAMAIAQKKNPFKPPPEKSTLQNQVFHHVEQIESHEKAAREQRTKITDYTDRSVIWNRHIDVRTNVDRRLALATAKEKVHYGHRDAHLEALRELRRHHAHDALPDHIASVLDGSFFHGIVEMHHSALHNPDQSTSPPSPIQPPSSQQPVPPSFSHSDASFSGDTNMHHDALLLLNFANPHQSTSPPPPIQPGSGGIQSPSSHPRSPAFPQQSFSQRPDSPSHQLPGPSSFQQPGSPSSQQPGLDSSSPGGKGG